MIMKNSKMKFLICHLPQQEEHGILISRWIMISSFSTREKERSTIIWLKSWTITRFSYNSTMNKFRERSQSIKV
jgi:hypothetical protein